MILKFTRVLSISAISFFLLGAIDQSQGLAEQEYAEKRNCIDEKCFGDVFIYIEGAPNSFTDAIGEFACRIYGVNFTTVDETSLRNDIYLENHPNLVLFLNKLDNIETLHHAIRPPFGLPDDKTQFSGQVQLDNSRPASNYLVVDKNRIGCDTPRCFLGGTLQFLEFSHDYNFEADQDRFDGGSNCN